MRSIFDIGEQLAKDLIEAGSATITNGLFVYNKNYSVTLQVHLPISVYQRWSIQESIVNYINYGGIAEFGSPFFESALLEKLQMAYPAVSISEFIETLLSVLKQNGTTTYSLHLALFKSSLSLTNMVNSGEIISHVVWPYILELSTKRRVGYQAVSLSNLLIRSYNPEFNCFLIIDKYLGELVSDSPVIYKGWLNIQRSRLRRIRYK